MRRFCVSLLVALLCAFGASGLCEEAQQALEETANRLREDLRRGPYGCESLNTLGSFEPVQMKASEFDPGDETFLREIGVGEGWIPDIAMGRRGSVTQQNSIGSQITVIFCGTYGESGFVFEKRPDDSEYLVDVFFGAYGAPDQVDFVNMQHGCYLLTNSYGHGTGTESMWTNWYNLDTMRVDLHLLRRGMENLYRLSAEAVTTTNLDHALDRDPIFGASELVAYCYTSVSQIGEDSSPAGSILLDQDCTVTVYESAPGGLYKVGERVFDVFAPAVLERASARDLLDPNWNVIAEEEELLSTTGFVQTTGDDMLKEVLAGSLVPARVVNTDWVNLRSEGDIQSRSIGAIDAGDTVYILAERQGTESGWTKVLWMPEGAGARVGYIWWSFLEKNE